MSTGYDKINSAVTIPKDQLEAFQQTQKKSSTAGASTGMNSYIDIRGLFVPKSSAAIGFDENRLFTFQFNPEVLHDVKTTTYEPRFYSGQDYYDEIWSSGGEREISFNLFMDATPGSYYKYFRKTDLQDASLIDRMETLKPRGILDEVELLQSFLRPEDVDASSGRIKVPQFSSGGVVTPKQFNPPPILIFSYGAFYLEGILHAADIDYTLWNDKLVPVRAEASITFIVLEQTTVKVNTALKSQAVATNSQRFTS